MMEAASAREQRMHVSSGAGLHEVRRGGATLLQLHPERLQHVQLSGPHSRCVQRGDAHLKRRAACICADLRGCGA